MLSPDGSLIAGRSLIHPTSPFMQGDPSPSPSISERAKLSGASPRPARARKHMRGKWAVRSWDDLWEREAADLAVTG